MHVKVRAVCMDTPKSIIIDEYFSVDSFTYHFLKGRERGGEEEEEQLQLEKLLEAVLPENVGNVGNVGEKSEKKLIGKEKGLVERALKKSSLVEMDMFESSSPNSLFLDSLPSPPPPFSPNSPNLQQKQFQQLQILTRQPSFASNEKMNENLELTNLNISNNLNNLNNSNSNKKIILPSDNVNSNGRKKYIMELRIKV